jgi:hypothetical protein
MNIQRLFRIILITLTIVGMFYLGYLFGIREKFNSEPDSTIVTATNGAQRNYLTQIERRSVFGAVSATNNKTPQAFGELLFIQESNNQTQLLFNFQNVPMVVKSSDNKTEKPIPVELDILLATRNNDGTDFNYESIGRLIFDAPDKTGVRTAKFSTTIEKSLYNPEDPSKSVQRIEFRPLELKDENIFTLDNADLPIAARARKAAYFWVNL